jgi:hypothetical protein
MYSVQSTFRRNMSPLLASCFTLVSWLAYFSSLKMEATCSCEASVNFQPNTWRYIPEDRALHEISASLYLLQKSRNQLDRMKFA